MSGAQTAWTSEYKKKVEEAYLANALASWERSPMKMRSDKIDERQDAIMEAIRNIGR